MMPFRIGHGFDVHAFGGEGPVTLGGVKIFTKLRFAGAFRW